MKIVAMVARRRASVRSSMPMSPVGPASGSKRGSGPSSTVRVRIRRRDGADRRPWVTQASLLCGWRHAGSCPTSVLSDDAAKPEMRHGCLDRLGLPGGRSIAQAVVRRAQVGATLQDLSRELLPGLPDVVGPVWFDHARVVWDATSVRGVVRVARRIEVGGPFPDVAGHVEQPIAIGWERPD